MPVKKRGSSFAETAAGAFFPKNKDVMKEEAEAESQRRRAEQEAQIQSTLKKEQPTPSAILQKDREFAEGTPSEVIAAARMGVPLAALVSDKKERERITMQSDALNQSFAESKQAAAGVGQLTPEQLAINPIPNEQAIDTGFAVAGGIGGAIAGTAAGAKLGALAAPLTGGASVPVGATAGAVIGGTIGVYKAISGDKRNNVEKTIELYKGSKSNMAWIINQANKGNISPIDAERLWDEELANFLAAERNIKKLTQKDLDRFLSGGADEAIRIEAFRRRIPNLNVQLQQAILNPNPNAPDVAFLDPEDLQSD